MISTSGDATAADDNEDDDDESSDDQDEKIKNVHSLLIKSSETRRELSSDYVFKRKLGDLIFDANFEAGNLGSVERVDKFTYDLMIRPDVANPRSRLWFYFSVSNHKPEQCVIFTIVNLSENMDIFNEGLTPVVRCRLYPDWVRLRPDQVFYHRSAEHQNRRVLSLAFKFSSDTIENNEHQFALAFPYTVSRLNEFLNRWIVDLKRTSIKLVRRQNIFHIRPASVASGRPASVSRFLNDPRKCLDTDPRSRSSLGFARTRFDVTQSRNRPLQVRDLTPSLNILVLCRSVLSNPIYRVAIGCAGKCPDIKLRVVMVAGWSSGNLESATMLISQGFIDFMLSDDIVAETLRQYVEISVYPMPDPDSIWVGNSQSDLFGQVNRTRELITMNRRLYHSINLILESVSEICSGDTDCIVLELKTDWTCMGSHIIGFNYEETLRMERHLLFPRLMTRFTDGFYIEQSLFIDKSLMKTGRIFDFQDRNNVDQYRLEISPHAFYKRTLGLSNHATYCQEKYLLMGKSIAYSLLELIRIKNAISLPARAAGTLDEFHLGSEDIDDLILRIRRL